MNTVFFNEYGRLHSGWRAGIFALAFIFLESCWGVFTSLFDAARGASLFFWGLDIFVTFLVALALGWACGKLLEGLPLKALGWAYYRGWLRDLILGFLIGAVTLAAAALLMILSGTMSFQLNTRDGAGAVGSTLWVSAALFLIGAAAEETLFRGYLLQTFARAKLAWIAIIITSVFFAFAHLANPNTSALALVNTLLAGLWFSAAYLKTRSLWLPFSAHFAWNWFQGTIFGIPVSGISKVTRAPVFLAADNGPSWLTGGDYGLEGGIACTVVLALSALLIWFVPFLKADEEMTKLTREENGGKIMNND